MDFSLLSVENQEDSPKAKRARPTSPCWYWEHGCCHKGGSCSFSHVGPPGQQGVVDVASIQTKEQCWYFLRGCCSKGVACPYAHNENYLQGLQQLLQQPLDGDPSSLMVGVELMKVPTSFARPLIGHGGENIRLLQQVTGCRVHLEPAKDAEGEHGVRILKIQGIPVQRAHCKELVQSHYHSDQQAKILKYENWGAVDPLFTSVKVALSAHGVDVLEEELELAKIRSKIAQFARKSVDGVDLTCRKESFETVLRRIARNFFGSVCQTYYNKPWLYSTDFQLVLEATIRELIDRELVAEHEGGVMERLICQSHDLAKEEKRFLPQIWDLARPFFDGKKTQKTGTWALELGRFNALLGKDEGSGTERAENFLRNWIRSTLDSITLECGDPCAIAPEEKLTEVYACLLNTCNDDGASIALPQQWASEAFPPPEGWRSLVQHLIAEAVVACRVRLQEHSTDGKSSGKGGKSFPTAPTTPKSATPAAPPLTTPKSAGPSSVPSAVPAAFVGRAKGQDLRPPEPLHPPRRRPSTALAPGGAVAAPPSRPEGLQNVFVRPRQGGYGTSS